MPFLSVGCPLLLFWPLVREVRGIRGGGGRACSDEGEDAVMEMRLRENPLQFGSALLQLSARYLFVQGAQVRRHPAAAAFYRRTSSVTECLCVCVHSQVFASVCAAAVLRRHLMVWKVFAPK